MSGLAGTIVLCVRIVAHRLKLMKLEAGEERKS
jgi:hypothetical protein